MGLSQVPSYVRKLKLGFGRVSLEIKRVVSLSRCRWQVVVCTIRCQLGRHRFVLQGLDMTLPAPRPPPTPTKVIFEMC